MSYKLPSIEELLNAGVHFGHQSRRWNPLMEKYIYGAESKSHLIDVNQTKVAIEKACEFIRDVASSKKIIIFVGTKRQARSAVIENAKKTNSLFVAERWLGGTFTNFSSVEKNIKELDTLIASKKEGKFDKYTKKERLLLDRKIEKLERFYGGLRGLNKNLGAIIVVDVKKERTAVSEAKALNVPVVAMVDTNCDPRGVDYIIPSNDDAMKAISLILGTLSDSILDGLKTSDNSVKDIAVEPAKEKPSQKIAKESKPKAIVQKTIKKKEISQKKSVKK